ncbi:MAG: DNA-processing protein DprA [Clostridiales Family XIII bacterium]|jgi:DNA processing protein|nr:DNA-processing protein DprA [Clostridiales Family XIII bacterium]
MAGFDCIERGDAAYPLLLSLIPDPPARLWYAGDLSALAKPCVAVVGSRRSTEYGRWAAYTIGKRLSEYGVTVVSGMAEGIDTWAHKGCLAEKSPTIAVFGCGLDICFPRGNRGLMEQIAKAGLILSEYEEGMRPTKFSFPQRNRIISGLSYATVVVEAGFSSGSLITAELALDQGRAVYAVPGNINRMGSVGCNKLIADGARPVVFIDDILSGLGLKPDAAETLRKDLAPSERRLLSIVEVNGEIAYDRLAREAGLGIADCVSAVTVLEMKGAVHTAAGKVFAAE